MATVECPGCGLPRVESELGDRPCPVCDAQPVAPAASRARPKATEPDPTQGMPADVSELYAPGAPRANAPAHAGGSRTAVGAVAFALGALCGIGGVLGVQAIDWSKPKADATEVAARPSEEPPAPAPATAAQPPAPPGDANPTPPPKPAVAPPQPAVTPTGTPAPKPKAPAVETQPDPELGPDVKQIKAPLPGHVTTHEFNDPKDVYSVPALRRGEHVVLKGKVKKLHVHALDAGAVLDASGLEVSVVTVAGKIDGRSKLKLRAPNGAVQISSKIDGGSEVTIDAPEGEVKFTAQTTPRNEGSKIDNGSTVAITARVVEFKGDVTGADTKVSLTLTRNAWLKVASVSGKATIEYKSQVAGWSPPDVSVGPVAPTATFRKVE